MCPQTGYKIGFGANKKKKRLRQSMSQTHWAHFGAFLFCIMMGRKMTSGKGYVFLSGFPRSFITSVLVANSSQ